MEAAGFRPTTGTFNALIGACGNAGDLDKLIVVRAEMEAAGVRPTVGTFNALIQACGSAGDLGKAIEAIAEMEAAGVRPTVGTFNVLHLQRPDRGVRQRWGTSARRSRPSPRWRPLGSGRQPALSTP